MMAYDALGDVLPIGQTGAAIATLNCTRLKSQAHTKRFPLSSPVISPTQPPAIAGQPAPDGQQKTPIVARRDRKVVLRKHFDLLYWWAVWGYAAFAAAMTSWFGETVIINAKPVKMYPAPWLGVGFLAVLLFVSIFTAVRARGAMSLIMVLIAAVVGILLQMTSSLGWLSEQLSLVRIHLNQGFYVAIAAVMIPVWLLTSFVFNRFTYYVFESGKQISIVKPWSGGREGIAAHTLSLRRLPDDLFVHRLLGAPFMGTGDLEIGYTRPDGSAHKELITNVTRAGRKLDAINAIMH